jgi:methyltransferase (TIGR00027 family)
MPPMTIEHISDTARWVAVYRAMETARPDALFRDPYAAHLAGERGQAIVDALPHARDGAWTMIVRTAVFDKIILDLVRGRHADLVVNLAAGLDARAWRLPLPPTLRWVDVDLPDILHFKTEALRDERPACPYEAVPTDLRDEAKRQALFRQLGGESSRALVMSEGLLIYLTRAQVGSLARDLHAQPSFRWWLLDLVSPQLLEMLRRSWGLSLAAGGAPFQFAPAEGTQFFAPFGWREVQFRSTLEEARRLRREMQMMWFWRFLMLLSPARHREQLRRMSATVLLERDPRGPTTPL